MRPGLIRSIKPHLASVLAAAMLSAAAVPAAAQAEGPDEGIIAPISVTEAAYGSGGAASSPGASGAPLTWNLLNKVSRSVMAMQFPAYDTPFTKLSADERYLAFLAIGSDPNAGGRKNVSVQDRMTGEIQRIRTPDTTGTVLHFDMTPDARYFVFSYGESPISAKNKVYQYDRTADTLEEVNAVTGSKEFRTGDGDYVSVSADGRYVAFDTDTDGLVPGDTNGERDVYLYDREAAGSKLERISVPNEPNNKYDSWGAVISLDGSKIAFVSKAKLTVESDYIGTESLYLVDRHAAAGTDPKRITQGDQPSISGDGRYVAFKTYRSDLGPPDTNGRDDIYVYDAVSGSFKKASKLPDGTEHEGDSRYPYISRNGAYVAYEMETDSSKDESDLYVADSQGLVSAKIAVPGSAIPLLPSGKRPTVGDTGQTVTFFSNYLERIGGGEFPFFDYFVASNGTAPEWPAGSVLQGSNAAADRITLSWPAASDPDGVTGYFISMNGVYLAYVPATQGTSYTAAGLVREPGTDYIFQVDAVDSRYHQSTAGLTYKWESQGGGNPGEVPLTILWSAEHANDVLLPDGKVAVTILGSPGKEAKAEWSYKVWEGNNQVPKSSSLVLAESPAAPGYYTGSFALEAGTTELLSLRVRLTGDGKEELKAAEDLPIAVGGRLQVGFTGAELADLKGSILTISGPLIDQQSVTVGDGGAEPFTGLRPGDQYEVDLRTPDYRYEMGRQSGVRIEAGRTGSVTLPVKLPAQVRVQVVNEEGRPVPYVPVTLWDSGQQLLSTSAAGEDGMTDWHDGLIKDETVSVKLDLSDFYYELAPGSNLSIKLAAGENVLTVRLVSPDRGNLELTIKNPQNAPVFNAYVTATQVYKGKPVVTKGRTSLDGKIRFELFAGDVTLEATEYSYHYSSDPITAKVVARTTTPMDIPVKQPATSVINLKVYKKALDTEWQGPLNMESERFLTMIRSNYGWVRTYFSNAVRFGGSPGTPVEVCVSGAIYGYVNACKNVTLDENSNATAEVRLEEKGARVQGQVPMSRDVRYDASVYELKDNGSKVWAANAWDENFQSGVFNINVPKGGTYRLEIVKTVRDPNYRYRYEYASVDFTVGENQIKNLGPVSFSPTSYFTNKRGNEFGAVPARAVPGGTVILRASYRNTNDKTARDALLQLDIPEGLELVSDSSGNKAVTGAKGPVTVEGQTLRVPLGDLVKDDGGTVSYKLAVSPTFNRNGISAAARIRASMDNEAVEEILGTVHLETPKITLDAPDRISDAGMETVLSGYAPAGSAVRIYDTNVRIGGTVANASGFWQVKATLTDLGSPSMHALWADTVSGQVNLQSEKVYVQYDKDGPQLLQLAMAQAPDKRWVTVKPGKEVPNLIYSVVPGNPFQFDLQFDKPDRVESVRIYMDGQEGEPIPAVREGSLFRAVVPTSHDALGGVYVDYDVKPVPRDYGGVLPGLEQIRNSLPLKMRDFEVVSTTPFELTGGKYSGTAVLRFPQLHNKKLTVTLGIDPNSAYKPTAEEKALAQRAGVPAIQKSFDVNETDTSLAIKLTGYMPKNLLSNNLQALKGGRVSALAKEGDWEHTAEYFTEIKADVDEVNDQISEVKEQYDDYMEYAEKVNKIMYGVENGLDCLEEMPTTAKEAGKALAALVVGEVAKTAMGAWVGAMALTGPGAAAAAVATDIIGDKIDNYVDEQIDKVGTGYNECSDNPDRKQQSRKYGRKVITPKWIYDPSGSVYEAVKSNPLQDVTATVLYLNPDTGTWDVWNAKEYEQVNPQLTDALGKYGWDVPPGKWKVVWSKEGYETKTSSELNVPPPQTEVNAGMVSRQPPQISTVTGVTYEGGSYIDITLSKYVRVTGLDEGSVTAAAAGGAALKGSAAFIKQEESADEPGVKLSRTVRFIPKEGLTAGGAYNVKVSRSSFISYAHVMMLEKDTGPHPFTVKALDTAGPSVETVKAESGGRIVRITFNEPIRSTADASKFQLNGVSDAVHSAVAVSKQGQTETQELLLSLNAPLTQQSELVLLAGAVQDGEGNGSAAKTVALQGDSGSDLNGLTVSKGTLSPAFNAGTTAYSLQLPAGTKELDVTAVTADPNAKLRIGNEPAVSGLAKKVTVPVDGQIAVTVEAANGVTLKTYTIQVTFAPGGSPDGDGPTGGGGTSAPLEEKDPLDLGSSALKEKKTLANGRSALAVDIRKEDITEALKDGKKFKEPYIEVKDPVDEIILQFPVDALHQLGTAQAALLVKTELMHVKVDAAALETSGLAEGATIRLTIAKAEEELAKAASDAARAQSDALKLIAGPVTFRVEAVNGSQAVPIPLSAKSPLVGVFPGLAGESHEVYRYDAALEAWTYVRSKKHEDGQGLSFDIGAPGSYAAMSFTGRFKDTDGHWAQQDIEWMARRLLVNGISATAFNPEGSVTRAEFTAMLVRTLGLPAGGDDGDGVPGFKDVNKGAWYYEEVLTGASAGLVNGLEEGKFAPDETITREQMAVMIGRAYRSAGLGSGTAAGTAMLDAFADSGRIQSWAKADAALAVEAGLMQGVTEDAFEPGGITTRAQAAIVLGRLRKKQE